MIIPFNNLRPQTRQIETRYLAAVKKFLAKSHFILSEEVSDFERSFASLIGSQHCVGVSSGADALYLALAALKIGPGDEVITQGTAYNATVTAILRTGAVPRFVDITESTLLLDTNNLEALINSKTKAILPVHLYGQANNMAEIMRIAKKHKLFVVEDSAQAHLATWEGQQVGTFGDIGCFSFYPTKNLGAFGDAGAIVTKSSELAEKIRAMRNLGQTVKNDHQYLGFNHRLDALQAIALKLKLPHLKGETAKRQAAGAYYDKLLAPLAGSFAPVKIAGGASHVYHLYVVQPLTMSRDEARQALEKMGVATEVHYPVPVYRQPFYKGPADPCPVTDKVLGRIFSIPIYSHIAKKQQQYVAACLKKL